MPMLVRALDCVEVLWKRLSPHYTWLLALLLPLLVPSRETLNVRRQRGHSAGMMHANIDEQNVCLGDVPQQGETLKAVDHMQIDIVLPLDVRSAVSL